MDSRLLQGELCRNCYEPYKKPSEIFDGILNHPAPLKQKQVTGNHTPFMNKDLNKAIMSKSISYKRTKNQRNSLTKKAKRDFFKEATKDGIMTSKKVWHTVKPFLTNNGCSLMIS